MDYSLILFSNHHVDISQWEQYTRAFTELNTIADITITYYRFYHHYDQADGKSTKLPNLLDIEISCETQALEFPEYNSHRPKVYDTHNPLILHIYFTYREIYNITLELLERELVINKGKSHHVFDMLFNLKIIINQTVSKFECRHEMLFKLHDCKSIYDEPININPKNRYPRIVNTAKIHCVASLTYYYLDQFMTYPIPELNELIEIKVDPDCEIKMYYGTNAMPSLIPEYKRYTLFSDRVKNPIPENELLPLICEVNDHEDIDIHQDLGMYPLYNEVLDPTMRIDEWGQSIPMDGDEAEYKTKPNDKLYNTYHTIERVKPPPGKYPYMVIHDWDNSLYNTWDFK
jgi:hypothetical protein